jgi:Predicted membrane protein
VGLFFLRWLKRLERQLHLLQGQVLHSQSSQTATSISASTIDRPENFDSNDTPSVHPATAVGKARHQASFNSMPSNTPSKSAPNLSSQIQQWLFQGNPVLKVAVLVLVIGVVLLLRFATEHWQLSLAMKLLIVSLSSAGVVGLGFWLQTKNRSFALALEGLGLAALFLTLFFAYYNAVIPGFGIACVLYAAYGIDDLAQFETTVGRTGNHGNADRLSCAIYLACS